MELTQQYYSAAAAVSDRKSKKNSVSDFAQATFDAFEPFINIFDPGASFDGPYHAISKEDWELFRRQKAGEKPLFYPDGTKFHPYNHVIRNIYSPEHVQKHICGNEVSYCTSGRKGLGLFYLDTDAHKPWQTDEAHAKALLQSFFAFGYFRASGRGQNGYLKIRYSSIDEFNEAAHQLQATLKRLFLHSQILCDIEVKGTITHDGKSGLLAKLPFTTKAQQHKRDETDSWDGRQLELFKGCPIVGIRWVEQIARQIEEQIDEDRVARFSERKQKIQRWSESRTEIIERFRAHGFRGTDEEVFAKAKRLRDQHMHESNIDSRLSGASAPDMQSPAAIGITEKPMAVPGASPATPAIVSTRQGTQRGDAFTRNQQDLPPFVRDFYKKHRAFPTLEDALCHLQKNGLFSGEWSDNEQGRAKRVCQILGTLIANIDPKLLRNGETKPVALSVGKFGWWVRDHIGPRMTAEVVNLQGFDPVTLTAPVQRVSIPAKFVETFLVVADFCLNQDPLENKAVPTNRIKKIWKMVVGGASWNQTFYQVVRDRLDKMGIVHIFDRQHDNNKAWRWDVGPNFPAESWEKEQQSLAELVKRSRFGISYQEFIAHTKIVIDEALHNPVSNRFAFSGSLGPKTRHSTPSRQTPPSPRHFLRSVHRILLMSTEKFRRHPDVRQPAPAILNQFTRQRHPLVIAEVTSASIPRIQPLDRSSDGRTARPSGLAEEATGKGGQGTPLALRNSAPWEGVACSMVMGECHRGFVLPHPLAVRTRNQHAVHPVAAR